MDAVFGMDEHGEDFKISAIEDNESEFISPDNIESIETPELVTSDIKTEPVENEDFDLSFIQNDTLEIKEEIFEDFNESILEDVNVKESEINKENEIKEQKDFLNIIPAESLHQDHLNPKSNLWTCPEIGCKETFQDGKSMRDHCVIFHDQYCCDVCEDVFDGKEEFDQHNNEYHQNSKRLTNEFSQNSADFINKVKVFPQKRKLIPTENIAKAKFCDICKTWATYNFKNHKEKCEERLKASLKKLEQDEKVKLQMKIKREQNKLLKIKEKEKKLAKEKNLKDVTNNKQSTSKEVKSREEKKPPQKSFAKFGDDETPEFDSKYFCKLCHFKTNHKKELDEHAKKRLHKKRNSKWKYFCQVCTWRSNSPTALGKHSRESRHCELDDRFENDPLSEPKAVSKSQTIAYSKPLSSIQFKKKLLDSGAMRQEKEAFVCRVCNWKSASIKSMITHFNYTLHDYEWERIDPLTTKTYCQDCTWSGTSESEFDEHFENTHIAKASDTSSRRTARLKKSKELKCLDCKKFKAYGGSMLRFHHAYEHHSCLYCEIDFTTRNQIAEHFYLKHDQVIQCLWCKFFPFNPRELKKHQKICDKFEQNDHDYTGKAEEPKFLDIDSEELVSSMLQDIINKAVERVNSGHRCSTCKDETFQTKSDLIHHELTRHHYCHFCKTIFKCSDEYLEKHLYGCHKYKSLNLAGKQLKKPSNRTQLHPRFFKPVLNVSFSQDGVQVEENQHYPTSLDQNSSIKTTVPDVYAIENYAYDDETEIEEIKSKDNTLLCWICKRSFNTSFYFKVHLLKHRYCVFCKGFLSIRDKKEAIEHMLNFHDFVIPKSFKFFAEEEIKIQEPTTISQVCYFCLKDIDVKKKHECLKCEFKTENASWMQSHMLYHHSTVYKCPNCPSREDPIFKNNPRIKAVEKKKVAVWTCKFCLSTYSNTEETFPCKVEGCLATFDSYDLWYKHSETQHNIILKCPKCFPHQEEMKCLCCNETLVKNFYCSVCKVDIQSFEHYQSHVFEIHGENLKCHNCPMDKSTVIINSNLAMQGRCRFCNLELSTNFKCHFKTCGDGFQRFDSYQNHLFHKHKLLINCYKCMIQKQPETIGFCKYCNKPIVEEKDKIYNCIGVGCTAKFVTFRFLQNHMLDTHSRKQPCSNCTRSENHFELSHNSSISVSMCRFCNLLLQTIDAKEYQCPERKCYGSSFKFADYQNHSFFKHNLVIRCQNCQNATQCTICRQSIGNGNVSAHMKQKHVKEIILDKGMKRETKMVKMQICCLCMKLVSIEKGMKHLADKHLPVLKLKRLICCPACEFMTDSFQKLEEHSLKKHMPTLELDDFLKLV